MDITERLNPMERLKAKTILRAYAKEHLSVLPWDSMEWKPVKQNESHIQHLQSSQHTKARKSVKKIELVYDIYIKKTTRKVCRIQYSAMIIDGVPSKNHSSWSVSPNKHEEYYLIAFFLKTKQEPKETRRLISKLEGKR